MDEPPKEGQRMKRKNEQNKKELKNENGTDGPQQ